MDAGTRGQAGRIVVDYDRTTLRWSHWGRPINRYRLAGFAAETGRTRGYDRDLEKMLVLSSSDKAFGGGEVTGKFGLGFKTVFLLTDSPHVVSDRLGFRVVTGLFPKALDAGIGRQSQLNSWGAGEDAVKIPARSEGAPACMSHFCS